MVNECLDRQLNKYDLVLCLTYHSNLKDCEYGIYIDNKHIFTESGLVRLKSVYKIGNINVEQEQIRKNLYEKYINSSKDKIAVEDLKVGHFYCTFTNRQVYLYLGNWKLNVESKRDINIGEVYNKKHHLFVRIGMEGSNKEFVTDILKKGYCSIQDVMDKCYLMYQDETLVNLLICDKPKFIREIGSIIINGLEKNGSFFKNFYSGGNLSAIKYTFMD